MQSESSLNSSRQPQKHPQDFQDHIDAVWNMRRAQKSYFKARTPKTLADAKYWEQVVDQWLDIVHPDDPTAEQLSTIDPSQTELPY